jgi:GMP synthase (glutamine-hydrolysing)
VKSKNDEQYPIMPDNILIITHQENSDPGLVGQRLCESGYQLDIRCPALGMPLPSTMVNHDGVVIFGGPMSANDDQTLSFIHTELDWISSVALESGKPFLGICLGAQLLARSLGAQVTPHPENLMEIGYFSLRPTAAGEELFASLSWVYHWHGEGFDLPADAVLMATGDIFPHQAFRYGANAYGLQFHPEITADLVEQWTQIGEEHLVRPGAQPRDQQLGYHNRYASMVNGWLQDFLGHWLHDMT